MRKPSARIRSDQSLVTDAKIELLGPAGEYVDVSRYVSNVDVSLKVGYASRVHIDLISVDAAADTAMVDADTLEAFAAVLQQHGWATKAPEAMTA